MTVREIMTLRETITTKAEQINTLALVAQEAKVEELSTDKVESLFSIFIGLSSEITKLSDQINQATKEK